MTRTYDAKIADLITSEEEFSSDYCNVLLISIFVHLL